MDQKHLDFLHTYNGEKFIREQLDSILSQTKMPDEIVISDDASTDRTLKILLGYKEKHPDLIKLLLNKENVGFVKNFERAIMNTTGDLIALSDQDDVWIPEKLEKECKILEDNPQVGMVFCDLKVVDENLKILHSSVWKSKKWRLSGVLERKKFFEITMDSNRVTGCTIVIRRRILEKLLPFDRRIDVHDHWLAVGSTLWGIVYAVDKPLVSYRQHSSNQIGIVRRKKRIFDVISTARKKQGFLEFLVEYIEINEGIKDKKVFLEKAKELRFFWEQRCRLYSEDFVRRSIVLASLFMKNRKLYKNKISIFKDLIFAISPKIELFLENTLFNKGGPK